MSLPGPPARPPQLDDPGAEVSERTEPTERSVLVEVLTRSAIVRSGVTEVLRRFSPRVVVLERGDQQRTPHVVLLELVGDDSRGRQLLEHLVRDDVPVVVILGDGRADDAHRAQAAGAARWVPSDVGGADLARVLSATAGRPGAAARASREGHPAAGPEDGGGAADRHGWTGARLALSFPPVGLQVGLTPRERQVMQLVACGMSNQEIADALFLSINSIKTHVRTAYRKVGARTRTQAVVWVLRQRAAATGPAGRDTPP